MLRPTDIFLSPIFSSAAELTKVLSREKSFEDVKHASIVSTSVARAHFKETIADAGEGTATLFDRYGRGVAAVVDETAITYLAVSQTPAFAKAMKGDDPVAVVRALDKLRKKGGNLGERIEDTLWKDVRPKHMKAYEATLEAA